MNIVVLLGNVGKDPETKYTPNGKTVVNLSLATTSIYQGEKQTLWHNLVAFGKTAEIIGEYVFKGSKIAIEGSLLPQAWEDKEGNKRTTVKVLVSRVHLLSPPKERSEITPEEVGKPKTEDDDIPF